MSRYWSNLIVGAVGLVLAACTSGPASTSVPGQPTTPIAGASPTAAAPPGGPLSLSCAGVPTFNVNPEPPLTRDLQLEAQFPSTIDGEPVTELRSGRFFEVVCMFGGQASLDRVLTDVSPGIGVAQMSFAGAEATVDGEDAVITAFRTPGQDATPLVQNLFAISVAFGATPIDPLPVMEPAAIGGKNVARWTHGDATGHAYVSGDVMFIVDNVTESQAGKILAALP